METILRNTAISMQDNRLALEGVIKETGEFLTI
jgi:hypothetical protein